MKTNFLSLLLLAGALAACSGSDTTEPPVEPVIPPGPDPTPEQTYQVGDLYDRAKQAINQLNLRDHTAMVYVTVALVYFVVCFTFTNIAKRVQRSTYVIK